MLPAAAIAERSTPAAPATHSQIHKGATEFEALFLSQMLRSAREASEDESAGSLRDIAEEQLSLSLAQSGGLGLAKTVTAQLEPQSAPTGRSKESRI